MLLLLLLLLLFMIIGQSKRNSRRRRRRRDRHCWSNPTTTTTDKKTIKKSSFFTDFLLTLSPYQFSPSSTMCIRDLDKCNLARVVWLECSNQFQVVTEQPQKMLLTLKVVISETKIIIILHKIWLNPWHTLYFWGDKNACSIITIYGAIPPL